MADGDLMTPHWQEYRRQAERHLKDCTTDELARLTLAVSMHVAGLSKRVCARHADITSRASARPHRDDLEMKELVGLAVDLNCQAAGLNMLVTRLQNKIEVRRERNRRRAAR